MSKSTPDLLEFNVDDDLASLVPMPSFIPRHVRAAITQAIGARFVFADELDAWLHTPHDSLEGATPFEGVVAGDGVGVLHALRDGDDCRVTGRAAAATDAARPRLTLVR